MLLLTLARAGQWAKVRHSDQPAFGDLESVSETEDFLRLRDGATPVSVVEAESGCGRSTDSGMAMAEATVLGKKLAR